MKKWNAELMFPTDSGYTNRVVGAEFGPSSNSGNPMVTLDTEVVQPAEVEIAGEQVNIAAVKAKYYIVTSVVNEDGSLNEEKTAKARERAKEILTNLGYTTINWDNIDVTPLRGKLILTLMESEITERRKNPTSSQIEAAKAKGIRAEGDVMKHPVSGKPLVQYWPKIREIFGLAPNQDGL